MASTTRRPSRRAAHRAAVERAVLEATDRLLRDGESFTELGVARIAESARIARSTFYLHFPDKSEIMVRIADELGRGVFEESGTVSPDLDGIVRAHQAVLRYYRPRAHLLAAITETAGYEPTVRATWDRSVRRFTDRLARLLRAEQEAGRTAADLDPGTCAAVIVWGGMRAITEQIAVGDPATDDAFARELAANQWYGAFRRPGSHHVDPPASSL